MHQNMPMNPGYRTPLKNGCSRVCLDITSLYSSSETEDFYPFITTFQLLKICCRISKLGECRSLQFLYQLLVCQSSLQCTQTSTFMGRNVITSSSTNETHPTKIPETSNFYACKFARPSSSTCELGSCSETIGYAELPQALSLLPLSLHAQCHQRVYGT